MKNNIIKLLHFFLSLLKSKDKIEMEALKIYLESKVIPNLQIITRVSTEINGIPHSANFELQFQSGGSLTFKVELDRTDKLNYIFVETTINDLVVLSDGLSKFINEINLHRTQIRKFFPSIA